MQNTYAIGIDVGGTNTDIGMVRDDSKIVARRSLPTGNYSMLEPYVLDIMEQIKDMVAQGDPEKGVVSMAVSDLTGIGMGAPNGNFYTGCVEWAPNLTIKGLLDFKQEFAKYTDRPFVLSNDANAAAYGEFVYGGARGMNHFIMITLGTGVGSGIVVDGRLVHGSTGTAGELGHNILIPDGRRCSCGRKGCLEAYTSARGIVQTYVELRKEKGAPQEAPHMPGWITSDIEDSDITSKMIGDRQCLHVLRSRSHLPDGRPHQSGRPAADTPARGFRGQPAQHLQRPLRHQDVATQYQRSGNTGCCCLD